MKENKTMKKLMFALATAAVAVGAQADWIDPTIDLTPAKKQALPPVPAAIVNTDYQGYTVTYTIKCPVATEKQVLKAASLAKKGVQDGILETPNDDVVYATIGSKKFQGVIATKADVFAEDEYPDAPWQKGKFDGAFKSLGVKYAVLWNTTDKKAYVLNDAGASWGDLFGKDGTLVDDAWVNFTINQDYKIGASNVTASAFVSGSGFGSVKFDKKAGTYVFNTASGNASLYNLYTGVSYVTWNLENGVCDANYELACEHSVKGGSVVTTNAHNIGTHAIWGYGTFNVKQLAKVTKALADADEMSAKERVAAFFKAAGAPNYVKDENVYDARYTELAREFDGSELPDFPEIGKTNNWTAAFAQKYYQDAIDSINRGFGAATNYYHFIATNVEVSAGVTQTLARVEFCERFNGVFGKLDNDATLFGGKTVQEIANKLGWQNDPDLPDYCVEIKFEGVQGLYDMFAKLYEVGVSVYDDREYYANLLENMTENIEWATKGKADAIEAQELGIK